MNYTFSEINPVILCIYFCGCEYVKQRKVIPFLVQNLFISHTKWPKRDQLSWTCASSPPARHPINLTSQTIFTLFWVMLHLRCLADQGSLALHGKRTFVGKVLRLYLVVCSCVFFFKNLSLMFYRVKSLWKRA